MRHFTAEDRAKSIQTKRNRNDREMVKELLTLFLSSDWKKIIETDRNHAKGILTFIKEHPSCRIKISDGIELLESEGWP